MNQYLYKINRYIKLYLLGDEHRQANNNENTGKIRHHKSIRDAGERLKNEALPMQKRIDAAHNLGVLAYTGGYEGGTVARDYIPALVDLLPRHDVSDEQRISLLQGLASLCHAHLANQAMACKLGISATLCSLIAPDSPCSDLAKRWACYALDMLCINNIPNMRLLQRMQGLQESLEAIAALDWEWWPKNHAAIMLKVLGFWPTEDDGDDEEEKADMEGGIKNSEEEAAAEHTPEEGEDAEHTPEEGEDAEHTPEGEDAERALESSVHIPDEDN